ncbi:i-AAA protease YME1 [Sporobolomyces koalae]|uniref:i-AAA protease YME1 n=1 Tax=Sporobolomyces koalae TaxID=500713 RepID=UPI00317EACC8
MVPAPRSSGGLLHDLLRDLAHVTSRKRPLRPFSSLISNSAPPRTATQAFLPPTRRSPFAAAASASTSPRAIRTSRLLPLLQSTSPTARAFLSTSSGSAPEQIDTLEHLFEFRHYLTEHATSPTEIVEQWERRTKLWQVPPPSEQELLPTKLLLEDEQAWKVYLKALASQTGAVQVDGENLTRGLHKLAQADSKRTELLNRFGWQSSLYPEPTTSSNSNDPSTNSTTTSSAPSPLSKLSPSGLISALFSSSSARGKGGEAKIKSTGSFGSWLNSNGNSGTTNAGTASEPIRVVVEEAKSPLVWRIVKFVAVTALYSFLLLSLLSLLIDSSGILRATQQQTPFAAVPAPNPSDPSGRGTTFKDVHGVEEAKHELYEIVEFLKDPKKFENLGGRLPRGVLLTGPPGTGKTLLARAVAGEAGVAFFSASGSEFDEMYVGVGARRIRELFAAARKQSPAIVFIDELDAIGGKRKASDQHFHKQTLNQLLTELDGFATGEGIILIGATNFPESLDKALVRPGRFDRHVVVPLPDVRGRMEILRHHLRNIGYDKQKVDVSIIARGTIGFSGADLQALVNQAAVKASADGARAVVGSHFEWAKERIMMGAARKSAYITPENKLATARHEAGHALVALYTPGAYPLQSITVVPRGNALGYTLMLPEMDKNSHSFAEYRAKLDVAMGGRAAEEMMYGKDNVTDGASSDIQNATNIASALVRRFGFSTKVGPVSYADAADSPAPSQETLREIDNEVRGLIEAAEARAKELLEIKKNELERLATALVEYETLDLSEVQRVIKGESLPERIKATE